jgi:KipI family sensor histidine kinase inhibitor
VTTVDVRFAGDSALIARLDETIDPQVNARAVAIARAIEASAIGGVRDVVPTFRSVAVHLDPLRTGIEDVERHLHRAAESPSVTESGKRVEIPVTYGGEAGPDLDAVAAFAGTSRDIALARHANQPYRVYMLGFLPGFAYLGAVDASIAAPRHATPRVRVPAGSVGIAGRQTGVYPFESPGGWQIIGRTATRMFDPDGTPAALLAPGDIVTFVPAASVMNDRGASLSGSPDKPEGFAPPSTPPATDAHASLTHARTITVFRPGLLTTVQDSGRWGHQASGVPVSGAMDRVSHRLANAIVGNAADAATLEATLVGPELRIDRHATVAVCGADLDASLDGSAVPLETAVRCRAGSVLRFGRRRAGARAYIAFDGGVAVPPVLGSRATHALTRMGGLDGRALRAGDVLPLGEPVEPPAPRRRPLAPQPSGGARLRFIAGPDDDFFPPRALDALEQTRFIIGPQSDRVGYRLQSETVVPRIAGREMISDATFTGAIQVPPSGAPLLLMSDRQTTGGYPQIGIVIAADLPKAAQLAPGDWIELERCSRADAMAALIEQEAGLLARA